MHVVEGVSLDDRWWVCLGDTVLASIADISSQEQLDTHLPTGIHLRHSTATTSTSTTRVPRSRFVLAKTTFNLMNMRIPSKEHTILRARQRLEAITHLQINGHVIHTDQWSTTTLQSLYGAPTTAAAAVGVDILEGYFDDFASSNELCVSGSLEGVVLVDWSSSVSAVYELLVRDLLRSLECMCQGGSRGRVYAAGALNGLVPLLDHADRVEVVCGRLEGVLMGSGVRIPADSLHPLDHHPTRRVVLLVLLILLLVLVLSLV
jgi:hypothetical protein